LRRQGEGNEVINLELNLVLPSLTSPPSAAVKYMTVVLLDCLIRHVKPGGRYLLTLSGVPSRNWFENSIVGSHYVQYLYHKNIMNYVGMTNIFRSL
jgi:hypothetical protein